MKRLRAMIQRHLPNSLRVLGLLVAVGILLGLIAVLPQGGTAEPTIATPEPTLPVRSPVFYATLTPLPTLAPTATPAPPVSRTPGVKGRPENCPQGWQFFDNTLLSYTICFPPDWGFREKGVASTVSDFSQLVLSPQSPGLTFFSPEGFPIVPSGKDRRDAVSFSIGAESSKVASSVVATAIAPQLGCRARAMIPVNVGGKAGTYCQDRYRIAKGEAIFGPDGDRQNLTVFLGISPESQLRGAVALDRLYIRVESLYSSYSLQSDLIWRIIGTLRMY